MFERVNNHDVVFLYTDPDGVTWLSTSADDLRENFGIPKEDVEARVLGGDCTAAYRVWRGWGS